MGGFQRQYPRIPVALDVQVEGPGVACSGTSVELGGGGMSLTLAEHLAISLPVQVAFTLPPSLAVCIQAVVWWKRNKMVGVRFDPTDRNCQLVQRYLEMQIAQGIKS
jgi:hypothetical protein